MGIDAESLKPLYPEKAMKTQSMKKGVASQLEYA